MEGIPAGTAAFAPGAFAPAGPGQIPPAPPPGSSSGPNPALAGILAIAPGVGAVYNGQYAKGLAHLVIFVLLVIGASTADSEHSTALGVFCGLGIAFFVIYQIFDAVRSAKAIQMSQPIPDPFGLAATFGGGAKIETSKIPMGAVVLILLGVLFLLHTMGLMEYGLDRFWPLILIAIGGWLFARNWGLLPGGCSGCGCARCRSRKLMGPAMLLTIGFLFLIENVHMANFGRTWPVILLVVGGVKLLQGSASAEGHIPSLAAGANLPGAGGAIPPTPPVPPVPPVPPTSEVNRG
jgi:LiaI-LiaF-like transmembrane region